MNAENPRSFSPGDEEPAQDCDELRGITRRELLGALAFLASLPGISLVRKLVKKTYESGGGLGDIPSVFNRELSSYSETGVDKKERIKNVLVFTDGDVESINKCVAEAINAIGQLIGWTPSLEVKHVDITLPDSACAADKVVSSFLVEAGRELSDETTVCFVAIGDKGVVCGDGVIGRFSEAFGHIIVDGRNAGDRSRVVSHEFGHRLGLPHPGEITTKIYNSAAEVTGREGFTNIQKLVAQGQLHRKPDARQGGGLDQYVLGCSVMGVGCVEKRGVDSSGNDEYMPVFCPPEVIYLDDKRRVIEFDESMLGKKIALSYDRDATFAVKVKLPRDHTIKELLPNAECLCFGPTVEWTYERPLTDEKKIYPQNRVRVFAVDRDPRRSTHLDLCPSNEILPGQETVLYEDIQLGIRAVSGNDHGEAYVRFLSLDH